MQNPSDKVTKVGSSSNAVWPTGAGSVDTGTPRVAIATDDVNLAAIKTASEKLDNIVNTDDRAVVVPPTPDAAETITPIIGGIPTEAQMVEIDSNTVTVVVEANLTAPDGDTAFDLDIYYRSRNGVKIRSLIKYEDMEVVGSEAFEFSVAPEPVGLWCDRIGIRQDSVGGNTPVVTTKLTQRK